MKFIQSFWSKPFTEFSYENWQLNRSVGGFADKRYFYQAWALSFLQLKKMYNEVSLITDKLGKTILIDVLRLPYTCYSTELENISMYPPEYWVTGKIYTYLIQKNPFIHIDGDLIMWDKIKRLNFDQNLIAEFERTPLEDNYSNLLKKIIKSDFFLPPFLKNEITKPGFTYVDSNMGIFGGVNIKFIKSYAKDALDILKKKTDKIFYLKNELTIVNVIAEQFLLFQTSKRMKQSISYCTSPTNYLDFRDTTLLDVDCLDFSHFLLNYKVQHCNRISFWLKSLYPGMFEHINYNLTRNYL